MGAGVCQKGCSATNGASRERAHRIPARSGLTGTTGGAKLLLPMQLEGNFTREIIKRRLPNDTPTLSDSRYHTKSSIRILIDDEGVTDAAGIPSGEGSEAKLREAISAVLEQLDE